MNKSKFKFGEIDNYLSEIYVLDEYKILKKKEVKNQLFRKEIKLEYLNYLIKKLFNVELSENINYNFSKITIKNKNILEKIIEEKDELKDLYIKCKHKLYLENISEKKLITIIRQLLRIHDYEVKSKEKYDGGKKYLMYNINKKMEIIYIKKVNSTINFD